MSHPPLPSMAPKPSTKSNDASLTLQERLQEAAESQLQLEIHALAERATSASKRAEVLYGQSKSSPYSHEIAQTTRKIGAQLHRVISPSLIPLQHSLQNIENERATALQRRAAYTEALLQSISQCGESVLHIESLLAQSEQAFRSLNQSPHSPLAQHQTYPPAQKPPTAPPPAVPHAVELPANVLPPNPHSAQAALSQAQAQTQAQTQAPQTASFHPTGAFEWRPPNASQATSTPQATPTPKGTPSLAKEVVSQQKASPKQQKATNRPPRPKASEPEMRTHTRIPMHAKVDFASESNFYTGFSQDISEGGLFVATVETLPIGSAVDLQVSLPNGRGCTIRGTVRWLREWNDDTPDIHPGMGIEFTDPDPELIDKVQRFSQRREPDFYDQ